MVSPVHGDYRRCQAETPLSDLFKFAEPALFSLEEGYRQFLMSGLGEMVFRTLSGLVND
jgi:hypothetical protein